MLYLMTKLWPLLPPAPTPKPKPGTGGPTPLDTLDSVSLNMPFLMSVAAVLFVISMFALAIRQGFSAPKGEISVAAGQSSVMGFGVFWFTMAVLNGVFIIGGLLKWVIEGFTG